VESAEPASDQPSPEVQKFDEARTAFYNGNYAEALRLLDEVAIKMPHDAVLHEFRSLVLFALGRYSEAAAAIHAVLAVGPGWDWKTLSSLYPTIEPYTAQLRSLEDYRAKHPDAADARFLLGYHYLTCGHSQAALTEFRDANKLQPQDTVSASLVRSLTPRDAATQPGPAQPTATTAKALPADGLIGAWTATGKGTSQYSMTLEQDGTFTWSFARGTRREDMKGVYAVEGNVLAMEPDSGGVLLAELTLKGPDSLHFQMVGGEKDDPGLDFTRRGQ
jgi:tetratricopeptide (TPR) repeat protein